MGHQIERAPQARCSLYLLTHRIRVGLFELRYAHETPEYTGISPLVRICTLFAWRMSRCASRSPRTRRRIVVACRLDTLGSADSLLWAFLGKNNTELFLPRHFERQMRTQSCAAHTNSRTHGNLACGENTLALRLVRFRVRVTRKRTGTSSAARS